MKRDGPRVRADFSASGGPRSTWVPAEHLASALSLFMLFREELSILMHPLTAHALEDHTGKTQATNPQFRVIFPIKLRIH